MAVRRDEGGVLSRVTLARSTIFAEEIIGARRLTAYFPPREGFIFYEIAGMLIPRLASRSHPFDCAIEGVDSGKRRPC